MNAEVFDGISNAQWLWYFYNFMQDEENNFTINRDLIEYHAGFSEPEVVNKVRKNREKSINISNEDFVEGIKNIFGRDIDSNKFGQKNIASGNVDLKRYEEKQENIWEKVNI